MEKETPEERPTEDEPKTSDKARQEIPLISVPSDQEMIAQEMEELFEEDKVTHKHGSTEPEAD